MCLGESGNQINGPAALATPRPTAREVETPMQDEPNENGTRLTPEQYAQLRAGTPAQAIRATARREPSDVQGRSSPRDPLEPVERAVAQGYGHDARAAERHRTDVETREIRAKAQRALDGLRARDDLGEKAARRLSNIQRDLRRLERDLAA
mgnify:FL=1